MQTISCLIPQRLLVTGTVGSSWGSPWPPSDVCFPLESHHVPGAPAVRSWGFLAHTVACSSVGRTEADVLSEYHSYRILASIEVEKVILRDRAELDKLQLMNKLQSLPISIPFSKALKVPNESSLLSLVHYLFLKDLQRCFFSVSHLNVLTSSLCTTDLLPAVPYDLTISLPTRAGRPCGAFCLSDTCWPG